MPQFKMSWSAPERGYCERSKTHRFLATITKLGLHIGKFAKDFFTNKIIKVGT